MRTKEEIAKVLAKRRFPEALAASKWSDLVSSIQSLSLAEKDLLVKLIANGSAKKAGERLKRALFDNARNRAVLEVDAMLSDGSLTLVELDSLI
jgi:hypothetical protein